MFELKDLGVLEQRHHDQHGDRHACCQQRKNPKQEPIYDQGGQFPLALDDADALLDIGVVLLHAESGLVPRAVHLLSLKVVEPEPGSIRQMGLRDAESSDHVSEADLGRQAHGQEVEDAWRNARRVLRRVVQLENEYGEGDGERGQEHDQSEVGADQRYGLARRGHILGHDKHEHGKREEHGDRQGYLLARVRRQPEGHDANRGQEQARYQNANDVVQDTAADMNVEYEVVVGLARAARVLFYVVLDSDRLQIPVARHNVVAQIARLSATRQVDLPTRVRPRAEFEVAQLIVEWKKGHVLYTRIQ